MGGEQKWNFWEDIGNDEEVDIPPETHRHHSPHSLKNRVRNRFKTILQFVMTTIAMNFEFFRRLFAQSKNVQVMTCIQETRLYFLDANEKISK